MSATRNSRSGWVPRPSSQSVVFRAEGLQLRPRAKFIVRASGMTYIIAVLGFALLSAALWDAFEVIISPRRVTRRFRLARAFYRSSWSLWSAVARSIADDYPNRKRLSQPNVIEMEVASKCAEWGSGVHRSMVLFKHKADWIYPIGVVLLFLVLAVSANAAQQRTADSSKTVGIASPTTTPTASAAIPLEEVASQAMQVDNLIRGFATDLADTNEVETIEKVLPQMRANLALELQSTNNILKEQPAPETLQSQEEIWQQRYLQLTEWLNVLTDRTAKLQVALTQPKNWKKFGAGLVTPRKLQTRHVRPCSRSTARSLLFRRRSSRIK